jgi:DNA-binding NtrC family response regulator
MAHLLLVEHHDMVRMVLSRTIRDAGHTADSVTSKRDAERLLSAGSHALMISNVTLPDGAGSDLAQRAEMLGIETVMLTASPDEAAAMRVAGIVHLQRPCALDTLKELIRRRLGA